MTTTLSALQKQRRDTAANWTAENPTLLAGEIGLESDTGYWKVGDGTTAWTSLAYVPGLGAEIPVARLADGAARQLLQTDAAGTGVEWTDDVDVPGTLDVTGAATFDDDVTIQGDLTVNGTTTTIDTTTLVVEDKNIEIGKVATPTDVTADGGGITLKGSTDKTINWVDATDAWTLSEHVDIASAKEYRIAGTKVLDATSLGSAVVSSSLTSVGTITSGTWQGTAIGASYLDASVVTTSSSGVVTSAMITDGTIVDSDISASAEIAVSKLADGAARQLLQTDAAGTGVEWTSDVDLPGNLTVAGAVVFADKAIEIGAVTSPTDTTADGGGIVLQGTLPKLFLWSNATDAWTSSEHIDLASGKSYYINGTAVLSGSALGSGVTSSSLTSVGTIGTGVWNGTTIGAGYGGTGQTTYTDGQLLIGKTDGTLAKATITAGSGVTVTNGDGSISISATGSGGTVTAVTGTSPIASTGGTTPDISIQDATTAQKGAVQLEDSTSSTSTTTAATPNAVKSAYDLANAALPQSGGTLTGDVTLNAQSDLRFADSDSSNWVALQAPATVTANVTWTLPDADGSADQVLKTDGSGTLGWVSPSVSGPILENQQTIGADYTLSAGYNGVSAGPVEVAATYSVTVPAGATWVIV